MTKKTPKISGSQISPRPKIKLLPDSNLIGVLKPEHYEIVDPGSLEALDVSLSTTPTPKGTSYVDNTPDEAITDIENTDEYFAASLVSPNLDDISLVKSETYFDINGNEVARFTFKIRNHVGESVVGVSGNGA